MVTYRRRVDWPDVDYARVVYFVRYQEWAAAAFHGHLHDRGFRLRDFFDAGYALPYVDVRCRFHRALTLEDEAEIGLVVTALDARGFTVGYRICRAGESEAAVEGEMVRRCITQSPRKSVDLPPDLRGLLVELQPGATP